jgi:pSer/pThr/pTyr-binding forkhead associated (FHA) protein
MPFVRFKTGSRKGEIVALDDNKIIFGRHLSCHCVLNHPTVSREHFFIERTAGKFLAVDNESGNGTLVNQERITWVELQDGDEIQAGPFVLKYQISESLDTVVESLPAEEPSSDLQAHEIAGEQEFDYPIEYLNGIKCFNARKYFDAHEAWEEIWLHSSGEAKLFYQMIIQSAVALYHYERRNPRGVRGMYNNVMEKLGRLPATFMSLNLEDFARQLKTFFAELIENSHENPFDLEKPYPVIHLSDNDPPTEGL